MVERPQDLNILRWQLNNQRKPKCFAPSAASRAKAKKAAREGNSEQHLALVRKLWCTLGHERKSIECHHLKSGPARASRGFGLKALDKFVVPLVGFRHWELENMGSRHELMFFWQHRINPYVLAAALWANTGDLSRMARVLNAHQFQATRDRLHYGPGQWLDLELGEWRHIDGD